nr:unnamed protein product [Digitaria exilis]
MPMQSTVPASPETAVTAQEAMARPTTARTPAKLRRGPKTPPPKVTPTLAPNNMTTKPTAIAMPPAAKSMLMAPALKPCRGCCAHRASGHRQQQRKRKLERCGGEEEEEEEAL